MRTLKISEDKKTPSPTAKKVNENTNPELNDGGAAKCFKGYHFSPLQNEHDEYTSNFKFEMMPVMEGH
jgi:hypothetical protein